MVSIPAILASSLWIAVCAAAPEFIWQGMTVAIGHSDWATLVGALLVGAILAFFVEPLMEGTRRLLTLGHEASRAHARGPLFRVLLSIAFAVVSVFLHDAVTSAVSGSETALIDALGLTLAWAWTPFAMSLAWLTRTKRILGVATAIFTILSPLIAAWVFSWAWQDAVTGFIPTVVIVAMGFRLPEKKGAGFAPLAGVVAAVSVGWLMLGAVISLAVPLYNAAGFWLDARFYLGWIIGLLLAPDPLQK